MWILLTGISLNAFKTWLNKKAKQQVDGSYWKLFSSSTLAFTLAYEHSCSISGGVRVKDKVVDSRHFRDLLTHLFVLSILWVHFQNADNWRQADDVGNNKLNFEEFRLASMTFTAAQAHENQTEQQMLDDFKLLDVDDDGYVDFFEVCQSQRMQCNVSTIIMSQLTYHINIIHLLLYSQLSNYCVQFIDPDFGVKDSDAIRGKLSSSGSYRFEELTTRSEPLKIIVKEMELHQIIAQKGALKLSTEMELGLLDL